MTDRVKRDIVEKIKNITTPTQFEYIIEYYVYDKTIVEIAEKFGVNKSTVSRTIQRGLNRCRKIMILK